MAQSIACAANFESHLQKANFVYWHRHETGYKWYWRVADQSHEKWFSDHEWFSDHARATVGLDLSIIHACTVIVQVLQHDGVYYLNYIKDREYGRTGLVEVTSEECFDRILEIKLIGQQLV